MPESLSDLEMEEIACRCRKGEGPDDVPTLLRAAMALHGRKGCCRDLVAVAGRLYTVVAEHAANGE